MMARGFTLARSQGLTSYWWHSPSGTCAATRTADGRYQSVKTVSPSECGSSGPSYTPATPGPSSSPFVSDLVGARAAGGETQMMARGFSLARSQGLTSYWWHSPSGTCAATRTAEGRYQSVTTVSPSDCGY